MRTSISIMFILIFCSMLPAQQVTLWESWEDGNWNENPQWTDFNPDNEPNDCFHVVEDVGHDNNPCAEVRHANNIGSTALYTSMNCGGEFSIDLWIHKRTETFSIFKVGVTQGEYSQDHRGVRITVNHHNEDRNWYLNYWDHNINEGEHNQTQIVYPDAWMNLSMSRDFEGHWIVEWRDEGGEIEQIVEFDDTLEELDNPHLFWSGAGYFAIEGGSYIDDIIVTIEDNGVPVIVVVPEVIEAEGSSEHVLNISNEGDGQLWWHTEVDAEWITCQPERGVLEPETDMDAFVLINADGLRPGFYDEVLVISSNDPERREIQIPVTLWIQAQIIHVPGDFGTIQQAINNINDGDSIIVAPGEYIENINFDGKNISIIGNTENPEEVIINGNRNVSVVSFLSGETEDAVLSGFTLTNGTGTFVGRDRKGGGIYCNESSPTLTHLIIRENRAEVGGGIYCYGSDPSLSDVVIAENQGRDGGGINCEESSPVITDSEISNNHAGWAGGGIYGGEAHPTITRVLLSYNVSDEFGGGIMIVGNSTLSLTNVTISGNEAGETGGGLLVCVNSQAAIESGIFWDNIPQEISFNQIDNDVVDIAYSDLMGGRDGIEGDGAVIWGRGNIDSDPLFAGDEDFNLTAESPCIDTGHPNSILDPDSTRADMGAFYFNHANSVRFDKNTFLTSFCLAEAFPNPFNSATTLTYSLPIMSQVSICILDLTGRQIATLLDGLQSAGSHSVEWNGTDVGSGMYIVQMETPGFRSVHKVILLK